MSDPLPLVVVLGASGSDAAIETDVLGSAARLAFVGRGHPVPDSVACCAVAYLAWGGFVVDAGLMSRSPRLRIVSGIGVGTDALDIAAAAERGVPVTNVPDYGTEEVADSALSLILCLYRKTHWYASAVESGKVLGDADSHPSFGAKRAGLKLSDGGSVQIRGSRLGLVGCGNIGAALALRAKVLGFRLTVFDPFMRDGLDKALGVRRVDSLGELLSSSDCVSLHCPLTEGTKGLLGAEQLALLPKGAFIVNTARGGLVDEAALACALEEGQVGGAALDVHEREPLRPTEGPLAAAPNLIRTPHSAYYSRESAVELRTKAAMEVQRILSGAGVHQLRNCLNKARLSPKH